jgi:hypothetical protein
MKRIVLDFLRRWAWLYIAGFILALGLDVLGAYVPSFGVFTPYFLAPMLGPLFVLGFDLMRGTAGVAVALPVSARKVGVGYWIVGVCVPAALLSLSLVVATIGVWSFNPPIPSSWEQAGSTFLISFLICGCIFFVLTVFKVGPQEGLWNNVVNGLAGACWGLGAFAGIGVKYLLDFQKHDAVTITSVTCVGLVFTVLGFLRCEEVVRSRARIRLAQRGSPQRSGAVSLSIESTKSGLTGFPYMFLESLKFSFGMALGMILFGALLRTFVPVNSMFIQYMLVICALIPCLQYVSGLRQLRALPVSLDGLAVTLFLLPLVSFALCLGIIFLVNAIMGFGMFNITPATLVFTGAIASLANAMVVRYGPKSLPFGLVIGIMFLFALPMDLLRFPVAGYCALSGALMIVAFAVLRSSLRCSNMYRLPAGSFATG